MFSLDQVWLSQHGKVLLHDISFEVHRGEVVSIIGVNGAWKSTLLSLLTWLKQPTSWSLIRYTDAIGYVPQTARFDTTYPLTVKDFLWLYSSVSNHTWLIERMSDQLRLGPLINSLMGSLSWGELQKVLLLLAVIREPDILILDEPTASIDLIGEQAFYEFIHDLHEQTWMSIVLVSHDIHRVFSESDRVLCLNKTIHCQWKPHHLHKQWLLRDLFGDYTSPYVHHDHI